MMVNTLPVVVSSSPQTRAARTAQSDLTSWLPSTDLESSNFDAQHFLHRVLSHLRRDATLDEDFNSRAVLEALDTVESALRRRRDAALRDEDGAREDLRNSLNALSKRHDLLLQTAHTVSTNVETLGHAGNEGATALRTDLSTLKDGLKRLTELRDARDFVALLSRVDASEVDVVHVSKLLTNSRNLLDENAEILTKSSSVFEVNKARNEIKRYEHELASNIFEVMKRAVDQKSSRLISNCTAAAEQLGVSERFVEVYLHHLFAFSETVKPSMEGEVFEATASKNIISDLDGQSSSSRKTKTRLSSSRILPTGAILGPFHAACRESVSFVREHAVMVVKSFSDARRPLARMLKIMADHKVLVVAESIISSLTQSIRSSEQRLQHLKHSSGDPNCTTTTSAASLLVNDTTAPWRRTAMGRIRSLAISECKEKWRDHFQAVSDERRRFLSICAEMFTELNRLKIDLFNACNVTPGNTHTHDAFIDMRDPYLSFAERHLARFLDVQKTWMDDQLGTAFFEITRIDMHAPRLAPRERSNVDVYHRYRSFYGLVSSNFFDMTRRALGSTREAVCRSVSVFSSMLTDDGKGMISLSSMHPSRVEEAEESKSGERRPKFSTYHHKQGHEKDILKRQFSGYEEDRLVDERKHIERFGHSAYMEENQSQMFKADNGTISLTKMRTFVRELLGNLVMTYLANVETLLQAATHLLPVCEADAKMPQLWMSGASPLTAYTQAIDALARSNELVDEFVISLTVAGEDGDINFDDSMVFNNNSSNDDVSIPMPMVHHKALSQLVPAEMRQVLHDELASGLHDLSVEAQVGMTAAISSLRARLLAMLTTSQATDVYTKGTVSENNKVNSQISGGLHESCSYAMNNFIGMGMGMGYDELHVAQISVEPSEVFISASTFVEQQLQSVTSSTTGENKDSVIAEMARVTRDSVLHCWCHIDGTVSAAGGLQMMEDGKTMARVFRECADHVTESLKCLPVIGQMFLEVPEDLWCFVDCPTLTHVDASVVATLLKKRDDWESKQVKKVREFLGSSRQGTER